MFIVMILCLTTVCLSACSDTQTEEVIGVVKEEEVFKDEKAPEGALLTYFLATSEAVLPEYFITNVTDDSPFTEGFRNMQLIIEDPTDFERELPEWDAKKDCYEETGVSGETLSDTFTAEKDGLYSMEVVCADSYGNASVAKVYVLFVTEELSASWTEQPDKETAEMEASAVTGFDRAKAEQAFAEVNHQRTARGLQPLSWDEGLYPLACARAQEIVGSFSHERPDGSYVGDVIIRQQGASGCGENIASNYRSVSNLINGWLNSEGHRETMLDERFSMGVMACYCQNGTYYWVNLFKQ